VTYSAWFRSFRDPNLKYGLDDIIYRCPKTGSLLEVAHDLDSLKNKSGQQWRDLFDSRSSIRKGLNASGIWSKKEWVLPAIPEEHIVTQGEGFTPLWENAKYAKTLGIRQIYVKQCGTSHSGSFKDLGMTVLVSQLNHMIQSGKNIKAVACASSGDTSAALAAYAAKAQVPAIILLPANKVSTAQLIQPISNYAKVLALDTDFDGCMKVVQELTQDPEIYLANSMNSLRIEGQKTVGIEVCQQLGWEVPDWFIIPGGNLGNVSALGNGLKMMKELGVIDKLPRIIVAQAKAANPLYLSYQTGFEEFSPVTAQPTQASAIRIGAPVSIEKAISTLKEFSGIVEQASEQELSVSAAESDSYGLFSDPHTAVALASLKKCREAGQIKESESVCVISTASALKFIDFKVGYHENSLANVESINMNVPIAIPATVESVKDSIAKN
jgi:threonine synthase